MKLSIFPKCKPLPKSKEEKKSQSYFTAKPNKPKVVNVDNENDLIDIVCNNAWSPSIFKTHRSQSDFISTDFMVLDIDQGMTIQEAEEKVKFLKVCCLCLPTTSHTDEHHRFRLIFPLAFTIDYKLSFEATMLELSTYFPADEHCIGDTARFYFGSTMDDGFFLEGELLVPETPRELTSDVNTYTYERVNVTDDIKDVVEFLYGEHREKIPEGVDFFIKNAHTGLKGMWHNSANIFVFTLALQGVPFVKVKRVFQQLAPNKLDTRDEYLLTRAYNDGKEKRSVL